VSKVDVFMSEEVSRARNRLLYINHQQWGKRLYILPAVITLFAITIVPFLFSLVISFFNLDLRYANSLSFAGLANFINAVIDNRFQIAATNTLKIIIPAIILEILLGLLLAVTINRNFPGKQIATTILIIPTMISPVVVAFIWRTLFLPNYGGVNDILARLGIPFVPTWLGDPVQAVIAIIIVDVWQWTPFVMMILLSGLQVLPQEPYESALIDGSNSIQSFWYITLPQIRYYLIIAIVFRLIYGFILFDPIFVLTGGGPGGATETVAFYIYTVAFRFTRIGYGAALSYILLIVVVITTTFLVRATREIEPT
jgi:multiple sugar transport system permease protein